MFNEFLFSSFYMSALGGFSLYIVKILLYNQEKKKKSHAILFLNGSSVKLFRPFKHAMLLSSQRLTHSQRVRQGSGLPIGCWAGMRCSLGARLPATSLLSEPKLICHFRV